ncbi:unnamed protein product [Rotaria socialis]|uniref:WAP domain-containing protein n=1 Tax=Rotaria socialis TaxID=392032 RepID=A0A818Q9N1_9BILA|nr:unnamed protein product [Rotaria socialis]
MVRSIAILFFLLFSCFNVEALKSEQLEQIHAGYCPMHMMACAIYCPPASLNLLFPRQFDGCKSDSACGSDEKCCKPACGCTNKCIKAVEKPGFQNSL